MAIDLEGGKYRFRCNQCSYKAKADKKETVRAAGMRHMRSAHKTNGPRKVAWW